MNESYLRCAARWQQYALRVLLILGCLISGNAYAHKVNVFAYPEGSRIYVQGYFLDGKKVKGSKVTVYGGGGKLLVEGLTNEEGEFTFPASDKQDLRIVLDAGEGHQAEYRLTAAEVAGMQTASAQRPSADPAATTDATSPALTHAELRRAVAEGVMPLAREIAELKERRSISDILGGIGFIMGVLGVFAYFQARRQRG